MKYRYLNKTRHSSSSKFRP